MKALPAQPPAAEQLRRSRISAKLKGYHFRKKVIGNFFQKPKAVLALKLSP